MERGVEPGKVTLGIRSEYISPDPDGPVAGVVVMDEYMGAFRCLHVDTGFGRLIVRLTGGRTFSVGEAVRLRFDPAHLRFFDGNTGRSL